MTGNVSITSQQKQVYNAIIPKEGPKTVSVPLDFSLNASYLLDFTLAYQQTTMTVVQACWIDNSANGNELSISVDNTGQVIRVPPNAQGTFPIIAAIRPKITVASAGSAVVPSMWLNVPLPLAVWYPAGGQAIVVSGTVTALEGTTPWIVAGTVDVVSPPLTPTGPAAFSVVTGGTPVTPFPANSINTGAVIKNPSSAIETLYIDLVHPAQTSDPGSNGTTMGIAPGATFIIPGPLTTGVSVNAATSGHSFAGFKL